MQREIFQMLAGKYCSQFETTYERKWQCPVLFETSELLGPSLVIIILGLFGPNSLSESNIGEDLRLWRIIFLILTCCHLTNFLDVTHLQPTIFLRIMNKGGK